ncbi:hypothetical protein ACGFRG_00070 [Streptomyces sp. NPDC048696]|uniref:hypothetical protein n=1 Tax=Streptomyces sp. NPDC048696 TaxID=3365585 RepID=UPI003718C505
MCTHYGTAQDRHWLDHLISWLKEGRPAVITTAPYGIDSADRSRLDWWTGADPRLRVAHGPGWYGFRTTQIVMWRTDRLAQVTPALLAGHGAELVPG